MLRFVLETNLVKLLGLIFLRRVYLAPREAIML